MEEGHEIGDGETIEAAAQGYHAQRGGGRVGPQEGKEDGEESSETKSEHQLQGQGDDFTVYLVSSTSLCHRLASIHTGRKNEWGRG